MPKMSVERSILVEKPATEVFAIVSDLGQWRPWNPWLMTDPEASVVAQEVGKSYRFSGRRIGSGDMRIVFEQAPGRVELELYFEKPFRARARVGFALRDEAAGCAVTWRMESHLPFLLFFSSQSMAEFIALDYERGLSMLKDYVETGSVPSRIEFAGESRFPGCRYVGITRECTLQRLGQEMTRDFEALAAWENSSGVEKAGDAFSAYRKWDLSKGRVRYTSGIPVAATPEELPGEFEVGEIPPLKTFVLDHVGAYRHLGNAWSCGMQMGRTKEIKVSRAHAPFETYPPGPGGQLAGQSFATTRTSIHFAIK